METQTKITPINVSERISGAFIHALRLSLGDSLTAFGWRLAREIDPNTRRGFSRQYVSGLEKNKPQYRLTPQLEAALWNIAAGIDEVPAGVGGAIHIRVLAQPGQITEGAMIPRAAKEAKCANPRCNVLFVKVNPFQKYHDPECRRAH